MLIGERGSYGVEPYNGKTAEAPATDTVARRVGRIRARLEAAADLRPSRDVNALFTELVELCCTTPPGTAEAAMAGVDAHASALRRLCAAGESHLEHHWSRRIAVAQDPPAALAEFPYLDNYRDLVRMELGAASALDGHPRRVAVLGSGPLPLTGLVLASEHGAEVVHVDCDLECLTRGDAVTGALGLSGKVRSVHADVASPDSDAVLRDAGIGRCDLVVLAALVGQNRVAKRQISARLSRLLAPRTLVLARSAIRLRSLLYPEVRAEDLIGLRVELEVHPYTDVVNSVLLARPCPQGRP